MLFVGQILVSVGEKEYVVFAVAAEFQRFTARREQGNAHRRQRTGELATRLIGRASRRRSEQHPAWRVDRRMN
jgi:hypothetical protein